MFEHQAVVPAAIVVVGVMWDALVIGVLAVLLRDALPRGPRTPRRRDASARRQPAASARSQPTGTAPAPFAHGAAA